MSQETEKIYSITESQLKEIEGYSGDLQCGANDGLSTSDRIESLESFEESTRDSAIAISEILRDVKESHVK